MEERARARLEVRAATPDPRYPTTEGGLAQWLDEHKEAFYEKMRTCPKSRRENSRRKEAREGLPEPVHRLAPAPEGFVPPAGSWAHFLNRRTGWYGVLFATGDLLFLLTSLYEGVTSCFSFGPAPVDEGVVLPCSWSASASRTTLAAVWEKYGAEEAKGAVAVVASITVGGDGALRLRSAGGHALHGPFVQARAAPEAESDDESGDGASRPAGAPRPDVAPIPAGAPRPAGARRRKGKRSPDSESDATQDVETGSETLASSSSEPADADGEEIAADVEKKGPKRRRGEVRPGWVIVIGPERRKAEMERGDKTRIFCFEEAPVTGFRSEVFGYGRGSWRERKNENFQQV